jgi:hypothetical protein
LAGLSKLQLPDMGRKLPPRTVVVLYHSVKLSFLPFLSTLISSHGLAVSLGT